MFKNLKNSVFCQLNSARRYATITQQQTKARKGVAAVSMPECDFKPEKYEVFNSETEIFYV